MSYYGSGGGGYRNGGGGYNRGYDNAHSGTYYPGHNRKRGRDDDPMDGPAYRRRANERGDFNSPGRFRGPNSRDSARQAFRESVWKMGADEDFDAATHLPALASSIKSQFQRDSALVFETMRAAVIELPHKLPHYAALIAKLATESSSAPSLMRRVDMPIKALPGRATAGAKWEHANNDGEPAAPADPSAGDMAATNDAQMADEVTKDDDEPNVGREIVLDLAKAFQTYLDERKWRSVRFSILLFAHLTRAPAGSPLVDLSSLISVLRSFAVVLDEPGLRAARGDECVRIIAETILRLGEVEGLDSLKDSLQSYLSARQIDKNVFAAEGAQDQFEDPIEQLIVSISSPAATAIPDIASIIIAPPAEGSEVSAATKSVEAIDLPMVLVPPEMDEADAYRVVPPEVTSAGLRGDEGLGFRGVVLDIRLHDGDTVPEPSSANGALIRALVRDVMDVFETNRKEAATTLIDLRSWLTPGIFKPLESRGEENESTLILEDVLVEAIFDSILALPAQSLLPAYYHALLSELCRISPNTVAPSLGRGVRKIYKALGNPSGQPGEPTLDAEGIRRFSEWFSVHLSNFGFAWPWKDWAPDMDEVNINHPKRVFVQRTIELEVRLSYYDRIKGTLPDELLDTNVVSEEAPAANYEFAAEDHTHRASAQSLLRLIQQKATIGEVDAELASFEDTLVTEHAIERPYAHNIKLDMAVQTILQVGSRSFSHFLNALERYLQLLRTLTTNQDKRVELLSSVGKFWINNSQFHLIVVDKLLQYRLVDPIDVVTWCFQACQKTKVTEEGQDTTESARMTWSDIDMYAALSSTVKHVQGKITMSKMRLDGIRREEETRRAGVEHEIDLDKAMAEAERTDDSAEIQQASEAVTQAEQELAQIVTTTLMSFNSLLEAEDSQEWNKWWIEGWTRQFCRSILGSKGLSRPTIVEAVSALDIAPDSTVGIIVRSAKMWSDFA
ncbi:Nuclear cap-binding protein subunit 1 [Microbotryomycetes sp. JL221]|nr:Nuclear cap-binding protein subunit 1 [Microbotryomycetes sp. JL221]